MRDVSLPFLVYRDPHSKRTLAAFVDDSARAPRPGAPVLRVYDADGTTRDLLPDDPCDVPVPGLTAAQVICRWARIARDVHVPSEYDLSVIHLASEFLRDHPIRTTLHV